MKAAGLRPNLKYVSKFYINNEAPQNKPAPTSVPSEWTEVVGYDIAGEGDV